MSHAGGSSLFTVVFRDRAGQARHEIENIALPMPGRHNALNATGGDRRRARTRRRRRRRSAARWRSFGGVRRRFTRTGEWNGVTIIDDYGHHPVEIAAVLRAARDIDQGPSHRRGAAASLYAACDAVRAVLHLLQRCRRRSSSPMSIRPAKRRSKAPIATRWSHGLRTHGHRQRRRAAAAGGSGRADRRHGPARRLCGLPWRRHDHPMGLCAAGAACGDRRV